MNKQGAVPLPTFAEKVRDGDAGTEVWFTTGGNIEASAIQKRDIDATVVANNAPTSASRIAITTPTLARSSDRVTAES